MGDFSSLILLEAPHWMAVNKPPGQIVERNPFEKNTIEDQAWEYLKGQTQKPFLGIVHRLDRVTSGVLILAKRKSSLRALNQQFQEKQIQKTYLALCSASPPKTNGRLDHFLYKDQKNKIARIAATSQSGFVPVSLQYEVLEERKGRFLLEVRPETGKFHQIRAQLAFVGCPILGDVKYGGLPLNDRQIALHAWKLALNDPVENKPVTLEAPLPRHFEIGMSG